MDFFEEIAKYRAARRLYAKIMRERFQTENPKSQLFRIFTGSCGSTLVPQQPINNIVRVAMHALMGILGGNQAIHTACWDEGYAIPSEDSARIALRTQQILAHECGLVNTIDPLAGSYFVESLTNQIEKQATALLEKIDAIGGMLGAIENGYVFKEIQDASVQFQKRVDSGERVIVGLNKYGMPSENDLEDQEIFEIDDRVEGSQKQKLAGIRADRNADTVQKQLAGLAKAIDKNENLMPYLIEAVKSYATIGEICGVMREKWGEFQASTYI
jgi:methylmalonyl-CoA mutase N-terminal domain/subunit